jgi:hypothetical protein
MMRTGKIPQNARAQVGARDAVAKPNVQKRIEK